MAAPEKEFELNSLLWFRIFCLRRYPSKLLRRCLATAFGLLAFHFLSVRFSGTVTSYFVMQIIEEWHLAPLRAPHKSSPFFCYPKGTLLICCPILDWPFWESLSCLASFSHYQFSFWIYRWMSQLQTPVLCRLCHHCLLYQPWLKYILNFNQNYY